MREIWNAVIETKSYLDDVSKLLTGQEQDDVKTVLATDPKCGVVIPGTGGLRKFRVALSGRGKRGGARVIYYFYNESIPLLLLAAFTKNTKSDLRKSELKTLANVAAWFRSTYAGKNR